MSFKTEWRWKCIKVFLERSAVGPFADVMRRHVALIEPHYTERRFFSKRYFIRQKRLQKSIYVKHILKSWPWSDLMWIMTSWQQLGKWRCCSDRLLGRLHSFCNPAGFKYIIVWSCIYAQAELVLVLLPRRIRSQYDLITMWATAG